jgi:protein-S-isoprenylcysteine O-methyltransferase Ste14
MALIFWQWRPIPAVVWDVAGSPAAVVICSIGIAAAGIMAWASFQIDHLDLFGLRQVHDHALGRATVSPPFQTPGPYRWVRHPMMLGLLAAMWAVPRMTAGHLLFNAGLSLYVLIGIRFEERDLRREFGDAYAEYQRRVPMLWPGVRGQVAVNSGSGPPVAPG